MTELKYGMNRKLLPISFGISFSLSLIGRFLFPIIFTEGTERDTNGMKMLLLVCSVVFLCILVLFLLTIFFKFAGRKRKKSHVKAVSGIILLTGLIFIVFFVISLLYGLIAVFINECLKSSISFNYIKGIINAVTMAITWLISPFFFNMIFVHGIKDKKVWESFTSGLRISRSLYFSLLILIAGVFAIGWLAMLPFNYISSTFIIDMLKILIVSVIGMFTLVFAFAVYANNTNSERKSV